MTQKDHFIHPNDMIATDVDLLNEPVMAAPDRAKMAELIRLELAIENESQQDSSAATINMQQTLFEHLLAYQHSHTHFQVSEQYLSVLTETQKQQLKKFEVKDK